MFKDKLKFLLIIIAGEAIFMLPFMIPRLYRPLILEAWQLSNTQIGMAFSIYGISAMISYIIGGQFADKYHPRILISSSLAVTAIASFTLLAFPSFYTLLLMYAFYGVSTILLMWGALIKVTHITGSQEKRSTAMGTLDAGRGLIAALTSSFLVYLSSILYPDISSLEMKVTSLNTAYLIVILFNITISILIWIVLKSYAVSSCSYKEWSIDDAKIIIKNRKIWQLSLVILSSYCGFKAIDNYSVYLVDIQKFSLEESSKFTSIIFWLRPLSAFLAGYLADYFNTRIKSGRFTILTILLAFSAVLQVLLSIGFLSNFSLIFLTITTSAALAYALRAIYFSIFGDLNIPDKLIGTTVGIVSLIGFMPDFFFGVVTGLLIDTYPGQKGFNLSFIFTAFLLLIGSISSYRLSKQNY